MEWVGKVERVADSTMGRFIHIYIDGTTEKNRMRFLIYPILGGRGWELFRRVGLM